MKPVCSNQNFLKNCPGSAKSGEFESLFDYMTAHIHQLAHSVDQLQKSNKPIFDAIYVEIRNLIFDFFKASIDVD